VISPAIIAGGAYQNVTARPADNAAITITSGAANTTYTQNMVWHKDAITFVSPKQELPGGMDMAYQASLADEGGVSLRFVRGFDITNNKFISRFDILWGAAVTLPNFVFAAPTDPAASSRGWLSQGAGPFCLTAQPQGETMYPLNMKLQRRRRLCRCQRRGRAQGPVRAGLRAQVRRRSPWSRWRRQEDQGRRPRKPIE
jgi:hypothetical protein